MTDKGDDTLVAEALAGRATAFDELMLRYERRIYNLTLRLTGNVQDAMDATQTTFLKALETLERFELGRPFLSWIARIGVNESFDVISRRKRFVDGPADIPSRVPGPEQRCAGVEIGHGIQAALMKLTDDYRAVIVLRHFHELSYQQMSEVLDVPVKTIKSRLFTARRELRSTLAASGLER